MRFKKPPNGFGIRYPIKRDTQSKLIHPRKAAAARTPRVRRIPEEGTGKNLRRLEGIMVCVGYSDYLELTLPWNLRHFDRFAVVTHPDDIDTQRVVRKHGGLLVLCPECKGPTGGFNKGIALNAGISKLEYDDWVLFTDADILLPSNFRKALEGHALDPEALYYAARWYTPQTNVVQWVEDYKKDEAIIHKLPSPHRDPGSIIRDVAPWGYFQLVNAKSQVLQRLGKLPCSTFFNSAGGVDKQFHERWPSSKKFFSGYNVVHIFHGEFAANWRGRTTPPLPGKAATVAVAKIEAEISIAWLDKEGYHFITHAPTGGYVKLIRMDNLNYVVVPNARFPQGLFVVPDIKFAKVPFMSTESQNGFSYGAYHAGFISHNYKYATSPNHKGRIILARDAGRRTEYSGWGLGHVMFEDNRQAWVWAGEEIAPTCFEIYWKQNLSEEDRKHWVQM